MSTDTQNPPVADEPMVVWSIDRIQKTFLTYHLPDYKTAFLNNVLADFWPSFFVKWFNRWPAGESSHSFVEEQLRGWMSTNSKWLPTAPQKEFLKGLIPDYKSAQENKALNNFWSRLFADWFHHWAPTAIAPQGLVEKKLKAWFNNHGRVMATTRQVLNLNATVKRTRRPSEPQAFCHLYWDRPVEKDGSTLAQVVNRGWVIEWKNNKKYNPKKARPPPSLSYLNSVSTDYYARMPHVHKEILDYLAQKKNKDGASEDKEQEAEEEDVARAREYAEAIGILPASLDRATQQIWEKAGLMTLTIVAGPNPSQGGNLMVITEGKAKGNCDFTQWCPNYTRDIEGKFGEVAPAERAKRALPGTGHLRNYELDPTPTTVPRPSSANPLPPSIPHNGVLRMDEDDPRSDAGSDESPATPTPRRHMPARLSPSRIQPPEILLGIPQAADEEATEVADDDAAGIDAAAADPPLEIPNTPTADDHTRMDVDVSTTTVDEVITSITTATHLSPSSAIKRP
ncbi:hypothetical protein BDN71DRAFT_1531505, partial [Pleurotus eryngii]